MTIDVKICGLKDHLAVDAAVEGGARYLGFMFYPPSPRAVTPKEALELGRSVPADCIKVGVTVDPDDHLVDQVHGSTGCYSAAWQRNAGAGAGGEGAERRRW